MSNNYNEIKVKDNMKVDNNGEEPKVEERQKLEKIVDVAPKKAKRGLLSRLITGVIGPEGLPGIGEYVNNEIIKPAIKNIIYDGITSATRMALFKDKGGPSNSYGYRNYQPHQSYRPTNNYNSQYSHPNVPQPSQRDRTTRSRYGVLEEYTIEDRFVAAQVLTTLTEQADRYDTASVADYYELIGVDSVFTDNDYGWTYDSLTRASIVPTRGGYIIKFPPVEVI